MTCYLLIHAMIWVMPSKLTPNKKFPHSFVHCLHQSIKKEAKNNPLNARKLIRATWRRSIPLASSLEVIKCNFSRSSDMSHASRAKIAPLNIQPMGKLNDKPITANKMEKNKPSGGNHRHPCQRDASHKPPKAMIQGES